MSITQKAAEADLVALRAAFNRWAGPVQRLDVEGKQRELAEREALMAALLRLHAVGRAQLTDSLARPLRAIDVERVLSCFRRLALMGGAKPADIADYCERAAADDDNLMAHRADPLMLRYVLTYHQATTQAWFAGHEVDRLKYVCERADQASIHAWFETISANKDALPKDCCQYLRLFLLRLWNRRMGDLETLAFEQAVLEVRLYDTMGWENTRMFCALLRRIGGGNLPAFAAYLNADDITEALALHEALGDSDECAHFRAFAAIHDPKLVGQLEHAVVASAAHYNAVSSPEATSAPAAVAAPVAPAAAPAESPAGKPSRLRRLFGMKSEAV